MSGRRGGACVGHRLVLAKNEGSEHLVTTITGLVGELKTTNQIVGKCRCRSHAAEDPS